MVFDLHFVIGQLTKPD